MVISLPSLTACAVLNLSACPHSCACVGAASTGFLPQRSVCATCTVWPRRELQELFPSGVGIHHAGMLRPDRTLMERAFGAGLLKVPMCLPAALFKSLLPPTKTALRGIPTDALGCCVFQGGSA